MPEATVMVADVTTKEGTGKTGKPWKLYNLVDGNGDRYTTFSGELGRTLEGLKGKRASIVFEIEERGNDLKSATEAQEEKKSGGSRWDDPATERRINLLACLKVAGGLVGSDSGDLAARVKETQRLTVHLADWVESMATADDVPF